MTSRRIFWCLISSVWVLCLVLPMFPIKGQSSSLCLRNAQTWQHGLQLTNHLPFYAKIGLDAVLQTYLARWSRNKDPSIADWDWRIELLSLFIVQHFSSHEQLGKIFLFIIVDKFSITKSIWPLVSYQLGNIFNMLLTCTDPDWYHQYR